MDEKEANPSYFAWCVALIVLVLAAWKWGLLNKSDVWTGTIYPDAANLAASKTIGNFTGLAECRAAAVSALQAISGAADRGDFECGLNCKSESGVSVCKETRK